MLLFDLEFNSSDDTWEVNTLFIDYHYPSFHSTSSKHDPINAQSDNLINVQRDEI